MDQIKLFLPSNKDDVKNVLCDFLTLLTPWEMLILLISWHMPLSQAWKFPMTPFLQNDFVPFWLNWTLQCDLLAFYFSMGYDVWFTLTLKNNFSDWISKAFSKFGKQMKTKRKYRFPSNTTTCRFSVLSKKAWFLMPDITFDGSYLYALPFWWH